ncbi:MAG: hypothetical protein QM270_02320 [Bacillota bacterium]|nr:hypothetical protein [Bacillota bacterium]
MKKDSSLGEEEKLRIESAKKFLKHWLTVESMCCLKSSYSQTI